MIDKVNEANFIVPPPLPFAYSVCVFVDDEQFNDEKAFLIKQIQDLRPVHE